VDHLQIFVIGTSNKDTWHNPRFLFWPTFQGNSGQSLPTFQGIQRSEFKTNYEVYVFCYYLTWKVLILCEHLSRLCLHFYQISSQSDFKYGYQAAILENQLSAITPELMPGSSPNFNHRYIYLLRIFYSFFTRGEHNGPGHFIVETHCIKLYRSCCPVVSWKSSLLSCKTVGNVGWCPLN
jgi:hypothetical protein